MMLLFVYFAYFTIEKYCVILNKQKYLKRRIV